MDKSLQNEIESCINDMRTVSRMLKMAAEELENALSGFGTLDLCERMRRYAKAYERAANKLENIL